MTDAQTEIAVIPAASLPQIIAADTDGLLATLARKVSLFRASNPDVSRSKDRDTMRSLATDIRKTKAAMDRLGKALGEDAKKTVDAINAERRILKDKLDELEDDVRGPLTAYEDAEKQRIADNEAALAAMVEPSGYGQTETADELALRLAALANYPARDWREFTQRAADTLAAEIQRTRGLHALAVKREAEAAELDRLRARWEDEQRKANHHQAINGINNFLLVEHGAAYPHGTTDQLKIRLDRLNNLPMRDWEEFADEAALMMKTVRDSITQWLADAETLEAQEREEAVRAAGETAKRAAETEAMRKAEEVAQAAQREREASEQRERDAAAALERAERQRVETEERAERERVAALERERVAAERAEQQRVAAVEAERARQERIAALAEADRLAAIEKARKEQEAREANISHRRVINREAVADIVLAMSEVDSGDAELAAKIAQAVVMAVAKGGVRHVSIKY